MTFNNTGLINSQNPSTDGDNRGFYYGAQNQDVILNNSGTIRSDGPDGCAIWFENDGERGDIFFNNSGTIQAPDVTVLTGRWGPPSSGRLYYSNTGTLIQGQIRLYGWPATIYDSGQVHTSLYGISNDSDVHIVGLPTIDPEINGGGSDSTLNFNLAGTLQYINGNPANGATSFSGILQGSIVVSGKTYTWSNFGSVSGIVNPDATAVTGQWLSKDVGTVGVSGSASCSNKVFTVTASGADVGGTSDAFRVVDLSTTGNTTLVTRVSSLQNVAGAKAGLMFRDGMDANAKNVFLAVTPDNGVTFQYRSSTGGSTTVNNKTSLGAPGWLKLVRSDNTFTGYGSSDGINWTQIGSTTVAMAATAYSGLAVTSHNNSALCTATFDNVIAPSWSALQAPTPTGLVATPGTEKVSLSWQPSQNADYYNVKRSTTQNGYYEVVGTASTPIFTDTRAAGGTHYYYIVTAVNSWGGESPYSASAAATPKAVVPAPWTAQEIGNTAIVGSTTLSNGLFTVSASGNDVWGSSDAFRFTYTSTTSTSFTAIARVASLQNTDSWSKAGLMVRDSLDPGAANAFIAVTPGNGLMFQSRSSDGGGSNSTTIAGSAPEWVKPVVSATTTTSNGATTTSTTITGYSSSDGTNWTQVGSTTLTTNSTPSYYVGLAVTSHNNSALCTATFDNVTVPGWPLAPLAATATDISSSQINLTWSFESGATSYNVKRATTSGGPYTTIAIGVTGTSYTDTGVNLSSGARYYYVISAIVGGSETANGPEAAVTFSQLAGAVLGTSGSYNNSGNTINKVFDGDLTTYFDGPNSSNGNGCWAGLDLGGGSGASSVVTQINYCPRSGSESRMVGGVFQGANQANFSDAVTLYTVTAQPTAGVLTSVSVSNNTAFRYVRYLSPNGGWGNVAEVQFFGYTTPWTPTLVNAAAASPSTVTGTTAALSVLGGPSANESGLTYTWATTGTPPAPVSFSANGTNAAKNTTATFTQAGSYSFQVTIANVSGASVTSSVSVTVNQTLTSIAMTPVRAFVLPNNTKPFSALGLDQFGIAMTSAADHHLVAGYRHRQRQLQRPVRWPRHDRFGQRAGGLRQRQRHGRGHGGHGPDRGYGRQCHAQPRRRHDHRFERLGGRRDGRSELGVHLDHHRHAAGRRDLLGQRQQRRQEYHRHLRQGRQLRLPGDDHECQRALDDQQRERDGQPDGDQHRCQSQRRHGRPQCPEAVLGRGPRPVRQYVFGAIGHHLVRRQQQPRLDRRHDGTVYRQQPARRHHGHRDPRRLEQFCHRQRKHAARAVGLVSLRRRQRHNGRRLVRQRPRRNTRQ